MMRVYLVRHGEAVSDREDPRRPLSAEGRRQVERVSERAAQQGAAPRHVFHSGKLRARETAEILARRLFPDAPCEDFRAVAGLAPDDDPSSAAELAAAMQEDFMIVGHLPHLPRLVGMLTGETIAFSTATMVCLEGLEPTGERGWSVRWIATP